MQLKRHQLSALVVLSVMAIAVSSAYGVKVFAERKNNASRSAVTAGGFVGQPKNQQDLLTCTIVGFPKKTNSYYYLAGEINLRAISWHEKVCFGSRREAESKGFSYRSPKAALAPTADSATGTAAK